MALTEHDAPRPALDAATLEALLEAADLPLLSETPEVAALRQYLLDLLTAAAERDALVGEAARYRAALSVIEQSAAASILLSSQTAPVLSGGLERIIQRCRAALAPAAGEGAGDGNG